jgi:hypothetical protein
VIFIFNPRNKQSMNVKIILFEFSRTKHYLQPQGRECGQVFLCFPQQKFTKTDILIGRVDESRNYSSILLFCFFFFFFEIGFHCIAQVPASAFRCWDYKYESPCSTSSILSSPIVVENIYSAVSFRET